MAADIGMGRPNNERREVRIGVLLEDLVHDLRQGLRTLCKSPGFAAVAVLTLALGIGANTAIFSLVNGILLRPLPYPEPNRLVSVTGFWPPGAVAVLRHQSRTMDVAGFLEGVELNLTGRGEAVRLSGTSVSVNLFGVLGSRPELGRVFQPGEDTPGRDRLVILSHTLWLREFGEIAGLSAAGLH